TSASSEQLNSMTTRNAESSAEAAREVEATSKLVEESNQQLGSMVASMEAINESSAKISKIIKVIDEIAFQTNILALNAAVEAARAGSAGTGFAVVADEVRNLAQRSAQAAQDTAELIENSIRRSAEGSSRLGQVADAIHRITGNASRLRSLVTQVSRGSEEQAHGIQQIASAIAQMEQVTQQVAANAEQSAASSEQLNGQAESVDDVVSRLTAMVGGGGARASNGSRRTGDARHGRRQVLVGVGREGSV
nr:methyl-accepting chemotaxis protein [Bryobacterales bacterium]